jgi:uncharacterized protein (DUF433 family)
MVRAYNNQSAIIRTERGLTIADTRTTIYDVMDLLKAQYPPKLIRDKFNLTDDQIDTTLYYIETNRAQVEAEYQQVLQTREEIRQYWEELNRDRLAHLATKPRNPEQEALWVKLERQKAERVSVKA